MKKSNDWNGLVVILDRGHGVNTPGKRSPDSSFFEWEWNDMFIDRLKPELESLGYKVFDTVTEDTDPSLTERANRANKIIAKYGASKCVFLSIHCNAAGNGQWMNATGWSAWTTKGQNNSDRLAECLCNACEEIGVKLRKETSDGDKDWEKNFTVILKTNCPAVLVENMFYDSKTDLEFLQSPEGVEKLLNIHVLGIQRYFGRPTSLINE